MSILLAPYPSYFGGSAAVYTFEMWGSGGGGGGGRPDAADTGTEDAGPGGGGAYVSGTLTGLTNGMVLEILTGGVGTAGLSVSQSGQSSGGSGGGASAIRIESGDIVAVAGGGAGGGQAGSAAGADGTGGRGGNSVDGTGVYATDVNNAAGGEGGQSGTATTPGALTADTNPPTKTEDLQDGGTGAIDEGGGGGGSTSTANPTGWGGTGGAGGLDDGNEGGGGGGGGGYFAGTGGSAAVSGNECGAGGGGGGSYINATYVSTYTSEEGSFEDGTAHAGAAVNQSAGSTATAYSTSIGRGGAGHRPTAGTNGEAGGVFIYKDGVLVHSNTTSAIETTYTIV